MASESPKQPTPTPTSAKRPAPNTPPASVKAEQPPSIPKAPPLYRPIDWFGFALTAILVFVGYMYTLAPDLTLEDSGELAVGSFYAGVPHPPGYPVDRKSHRLNSSH